MEGLCGVYQNRLLHLWNVPDGLSSWRMLGVVWYDLEGGVGHHLLSCNDPSTGVFSNAGPAIWSASDCLPDESAKGVRTIRVAIMPGECVCVRQMFTPMQVTQVCQQKLFSKIVLVHGSRVSSLRHPMLVRQVCPPNMVSTCARQMSPPKYVLQKWPPNVPCKCAGKMSPSCLLYTSPSPRD